jgi:ferritin-like metal-binding protein YciE
MSSGTLPRHSVLVRCAGSDLVGFPIKSAIAAHLPDEHFIIRVDGRVKSQHRRFEEIDETPRGKTCDAIMGIIDEGQDVMKEFKGAPAFDAGLLAAAQAVEHYEIARYGTLKTWTAELGLNQAMKLLETTLAEEKKTDETLTQLAENQVNQHAQAAWSACGDNSQPPSLNLH